MMSVFIHEYTNTVGVFPLFVTTLISGISYTVLMILDNLLFLLR